MPSEELAQNLSRANEVCLSAPSLLYVARILPTSPSQLIEWAFAGTQRKVITSMVSKMIDKVIATGLSASLQMLEYRKSARTWRRSLGPIVQVVNVQASMTNYAGAESFTMNLGICARDLPGLFGDDALDSPKEHDCVLRQRIGALMPARAENPAIRERALMPGTGQCAHFVAT